jgi:transcriptional regulator with XRE-family HTH domain
MNYFARRCGVALSSISRIINGKQANLTDKMKQRLATGLGVSLRELEDACRDGSLHLMLDEMERISDNLSQLMTLRERNQILSIIQKARIRTQQEKPTAASNED